MNGASKDYLAEAKSYLHEKQIIAVGFDYWFTLVKAKDGERRERTSKITGAPLERVYEVWSELQRNLFRTTRDFVEKFLTNIGISEDSPKYEDLKKKLCDYYDSDAMNCQVYPDVIDTLSYLKKKKYKLGLLSNMHSPYKKSFYRLHLNKFFDAVCFSDEIGAKKPDSSAYHSMIQMLGLPLYRSGILFVGDDPSHDATVPRESENLPALLLDREDKHKEIPYRIQSLADLTNLL